VHETVAVPRCPPVGLGDYWSMLKAKGPRLPINYFLHAHLFDLRYRTDTHRWLPKDSFEERPRNFEHSVLYMCSWTGEVRRAFRRTRELLGEGFRSYAFADIGCGKGKVVLVWRQECARAGLSQPLWGIDYYGRFIEIARANCRRMFGDDGQFLCGDATSMELPGLGQPLIAYMYNPFDEQVLRQVVSRLSRSPSLIIYNNPVHARTILEFGYRAVDERRGFHPNAQTTILSNHVLAGDQAGLQPK
jgi:SAM-dependent methyltransferase